MTHAVLKLLYWEKEKKKKHTHTKLAVDSVPAVRHHSSLSAGGLSAIRPHLNLRIMFYALVPGSGRPRASGLDLIRWDWAANASGNRGGKNVKALIMTQRSRGGVGSGRLRLRSPSLFFFIITIIIIIRIPALVPPGCSGGHFL